MEPTRKNGNGFSKPHPLVVAVISAILASGSTVGVVFNTSAGKSLARPDPYTGSEAQVLEQRVESLENSHDYHVRNHPDQMKNFDSRLATLEANQLIIMSLLTNLTNK